MYVLDTKTNLGSQVIPVGSTQLVTVYSEFSVIPSGSTTSQLAVYNTGDIVIGDPATVNNVAIAGGVTSSFIQLTNSNTSYLLNDNDYAVEVISDTYNAINLPSASGIGGRTYVISRGSNNNNLVLNAQSGENIDTRSQIQFKKKHDHIRIMANGQDSWYVV